MTVAPARPLRRQAALLAIGLYVLAALAVQVQLPGERLSGDEPEYVYLGSRLANGDGYTVGPSAVRLLPGGSLDPSWSGSRRGDRPDPVDPGPATATAWRQPGLPALLAAIDLVVPGRMTERVRSTRVVFSLVVALHAPLLLALGTLLGHRRAGVFAAIVWIVDPVGRFFAGSLLAEGLASLLVCAGLACILQAARVAPRPGARGARFWAALGGFVLGAAVVTRGYLLGLLLLAVLWAAVARPRLPRATVAVLALNGLVLPGLWIARNIVAMDAVTLSTQTWEQVYVGNDDRAGGSWAGSTADRAWRTAAVLTEDPEFLDRSEAERDAVMRRLAADQVRRRPLRTLLLLPKKVAITLLSPRSLGRLDAVWLGSLAALAVYAVARVRRTVPLWPVALLVAPLAALVLASAVTFGESRFRFPAAAPVLLLASVAVAQLARQVAPRRKEPARP